MTTPVDRRHIAGSADRAARTDPVPPATLYEEDPSLMASAERRYVEVFYDLADEYPTVYADDAALATWLRLLMLAGAVWPAPAAIPRNVKDKPLKVLTDAGLVEVLDRDHYRVKGLDKLRRSRRERAQRAAAERWQSVGNAGADARAMRTQSERNADADAEAMPHNSTNTPLEGDNRTNVQKRDDERWASERGEIAVELSALAEELTGQANVLRNPLSGYSQKLRELAAVYGLDAVTRSMRMVNDSLGRTTIRELVFNTEQALARNIDKKAVAAEERAEERDNDLERRLERTQITAHNGGGHIDPSLFPRCPLCREQIA